MTAQRQPNRVCIIEDGEFGDELHIFKARVCEGCVFLGYEVAVPSQGIARAEDEIAFPPEKARALARLLIEKADEAEKRSLQVLKTLLPGYSLFEVEKFYDYCLRHGLELSDLEEMDDSEIKELLEEWRKQNAECQ